MNLHSGRDLCLTFGLSIEGIITKCIPDGIQVKLIGNVHENDDVNLVNLANKEVSNGGRITIWLNVLIIYWIHLLNHVLGKCWHDFVCFLFRHCCFGCFVVACDRHHSEWSLSEGSESSYCHPIQLKFNKRPALLRDTLKLQARSVRPIYSACFLSVLSLHFSEVRSRHEPVTPYLDSWFLLMAHCYPSIHNLLSCKDYFMIWLMCTLILPS